VTAPAARELLATECYITAAATDYVDSFTNEYGELLLFHQRAGERTGTLYHSDMNWEPVTVDDNAITFDKRLRGGIALGEWIIDAEEAVWLARCVLTTSRTRSHRHRPGDTRQGGR
jgi:hypothetical protein